MHNNNGFISTQNFDFYKQKLSDNAIFEHDGLLPEEISEEIIKDIISNLDDITSGSKTRLRIKFFSIVSSMLLFVKVQSDEIKPLSKKLYRFKIAKTQDEYIAFFSAPVNKLAKNDLEEELITINKLDWKNVKIYIRNHPEKILARILAEVKANSDSHLLFRFEATNNTYDYLHLISYRS